MISGVCLCVVVVVLFCVCRLCFFFFYFFFFSLCFVADNMSSLFVLSVLLSCIDFSSTVLSSSLSFCVLLFGLFLLVLVCVGLCWPVLGCVGLYIYFTIINNKK